MLLFSFLAAQAVQADSLTYYVYPAPRTIDWRTPADLAWSTIFSHFSADRKFRSPHEIGHVNFALECGPSHELPGGARVLTGQTNSDDEGMEDKLLKQGYGLGVLMEDYPGRWETAEEIAIDLPERFKQGKIGFIHFSIAPSTCARIVRYLNEYVTLGYDRIYGGLQELPRLRQGGGCSAFGESVLEIAGLMAPEWKRAWRTSVNVPNQMIGGPSTGRFVSLWSTLFGAHANRWSGDTRNAYALSFWNPELMYQWIRRASNERLPLSGMTYRPLKQGRARGLAVDATQLPTPTEDFWMN